MVRVDGVAPGGGVFLVDELRDGNFGEVGIAHEVGAIIEGAAKGFGFEVNGLGGAVAGFREVEAFEDIEDFDERDSSGRWRRRADDVVAAIGAANRLALFDFVGGEVCGGDKASAFMNGRSQFAGHGSVVEGVGIFGEAFEGAGEFRLLENFAWLIVVSVAQENALGFGKLGEMLISFQILRVFVGEREAIASEFDGGRHYFFDRQFAILFFGVDEASDRAGDADGSVSDDARFFAGFGEDVALGIEIHVFGGGGGRFFAEVDEVSFAVGVAQEQKSASAKVSGLGMDDGEREAGGDGGIDGVASRAQHLDSGARGELVNAGDDGMRRVGGAQRRGRDVGDA